MVWWIWVLIAFVLLGLELLTTTLHLAFFGAGALVVALLVAVGFGGPLWAQLLIFTLSSIVLLLFRGRLIKLIKLPANNEPIDSLAGATAIAGVAMAPQALGRAELRGSSWSAKNIGTIAIDAGERCPVVRVDGLTLCLRSAADTSAS